MVQFQLRDAEKAQALREGTKIELSKIGRQIDILENLKEVHGDLSKLKESSQKAEQSLTSLEQGTEALQQCLNSLSGLTLRAQKIKLEMTQGTVDTPASLKAVIAKSIEKVNSSINGFSETSSKEIIEYASIYKNTKESSDKDYEEKLTGVTALFQSFNIEITGYRSSIPVDNIHSAQDCLQKIKEMKIFHNRYDLLSKDQGKKIEQSREAMKSTPFFREKLLPIFEVVEHYLHDQEIKMATDSSVFVKDKPPAEHLLGKIKEDFNRKVPQIEAYQCTETEMQDFHDKMQTFVDANMADVTHSKHYYVKMKAIIDYYYAPATQPLQKQIEENQLEIASTREVVEHTHSQITRLEQQHKDLKHTFRELAGGVSDPPLKTIQEIKQQLQELHQQQYTLQEGLNQRPTQREAPGQTPEQAMVAKHWKGKMKTVPESSTSIEHKSETFKDKKVREYTDLLSDTYQSKYGKEVDRQQAIDSATFLSEQKFVGEKLERSIAVTAHLLHQFGVSLNKIHLNRDTYEIHIAQPGEPNAGKHSNLEPLRINRYGVLLIDNKKLKAGVVATKEGTHTLILSVRAKGISFAANTVMSQSGGVDFEDLLSLKKGGSMDITALAVAREFREEAPGYELVPDTLQSFRSHTTSSDHVRLFRASARETSNTVRVDTHEMLETTGVFPLDVPTFIQKYQLDFCNFSAPEDRFDTMQSLWKEASSKNVIGKLSSHNQKPQQDFFTSYNVMFTVDSIGETLKTLPKEKLSWRHINVEGPGSTAATIW